MKYSACSCYLVLAAACIGTTLGNEDPDCPLQPTGRRSDTKLLEELLTIQARCLNVSTGLDLKRLDGLKGIAEHRAFFGDLCRGRSTTRECLAAEYTKWISCYNDTLAKVFTVLEDLLEASWTKGCATDDGELLAFMTEGYHRHTDDYRARNPFVRECVVYTLTRWTMVARSPASLTTKMWFAYRELRTFARCFAETRPDDSLVSVTVRYVDDVLDEMKCVHPVDDSLVPCKSIDEVSIDRASACPFRTENLRAAPIGDFLERRLFGCFIVYEPHGQDKLSDASTREQLGAYFDNYCRRHSRVTLCLNETTIVAEVCLHDAQFKNFNLETHWLNNVLEAGCLEDGRRLANIFHAAKRLQNDTDQSDGLLACLTAAESLNAAVPMEDPTRLYRVYQELPVAGRCIVEKTTGDDAYLDDVNGFIDAVMAEMKCVDVRDGSVVPCRTIGSK